jgi:hypothetical protein
MCLPSNKKNTGRDSKIEKLCLGAERKAKQKSEEKINLYAM